MTIALCPGSFDPVTYGHIDVIERAARHFDRLIVGVVYNPNKQSGLFTHEERVDLLHQVLRHLPNIEIDAFSGLLVDYASRKGVTIIVKGLRAVSDFDYELQMAQMNQKLSGIDTVFMPTSPAYSYLSSSLIKEVARLGGDISSHVPEVVELRLKEKFA